MDKITQTARYRQSLIEYAKKNGVTAAAIRYRTYRQYIYRWMKRYDGTLQSLEDRSHRPHSHPNQHRPEEIKLIDDMRRRNPNAGLVVFCSSRFQLLFPTWGQIAHAFLTLPPLSIAASFDLHA